METLTSGRSKRSTAGKNSKYDERNYMLVSFPKLKKHAMVPSLLVNVDPLDKQNGNIKTNGTRKPLRIICAGSKSEVAERKTRFEQTTESEEVIINQDDYENDDENSGIEDTDNYATKTAPHRSKLTQMTQPYIGFPSESNRLPLTTIQENDFSTSDMQRQRISLFFS
ncbi:unnamed protein product [Didymodactylos carnosus]|uniref:Uncharacterized protein n=1 Tax=Didymodactylos carnosus TaxID=1234261 RepID=A0A815X4T7_9BILA|nr:unnamed protein product [Didymodactylos carnosus]CAF4414638.1 unnamed protein product [Didymodactylos carnosus]